MIINLDKLQSEMEKTLALLKDRQPGMMSWHMFLNERLENLCNLIGDSNPSFPSLTLAPELIPEYTDATGAKRKWEVVEDVAPTDFDWKAISFRSFLKDGVFPISGDEMRKRAVAMKGNLGLVDAKRFLAEQKKIPRGLRGLYIVFPGTVLRGPGGRLFVACLCWGDVRWSLGWHWLDGGWGVDDRFACSESR